MIEKFLNEFEQLTLFERFFDESDFFCKKMFGGLACYYRGLMVACLMEGELDETTWKGKKFPFPLWRGLLIPTDFCYHQTLLQDLKGASQHPVLGKWLYLPLDSDFYDETARRYIVLLAQGDPRLGIVPKGRKKSKATRNNKSIKVKSGKKITKTAARGKK